MTNLNALEQEHPATDLYTFYVGTYTEATSEGIYKYLLHSDGSISEMGLVAKTENPSWITLSTDKNILLAVNEIDTAHGKGITESYSVLENGLQLSGRKSSGGAHPCFTTVNDTGKVLTANYTGGNVALHQIKDDNSLSDILDLQQHTGSSIDKRQETPHAHSAWFEPETDTVISLDLGTDQIWFSRIDEKENKLTPLEQQTLNFVPGSGPRHLCFHPNKKWFYVVNELNSTVTLITKTEAGDYLLGESFSTLPPAFSGENHPSHIKMTADGAFLYVANRGYDSIAVFKTSFSDGSLKLLGQKSTGGKNPRSFSLSPDEKYILIANQETDNIVILSRNKLNGLLKYKKKFIVSTPACICF